MPELAEWERELLEAEPGCVCDPDRPGWHDANGRLIMFCRVHQA